MPEKPFRPMLAADAEWSDYEKIFSHNCSFLYASPKLDGIRAVVRGGQLVSRTLKPIRNRHIQSLLGKPEFEGLDGELIVGAPYGEGVFARTSSGVMSEFGTPDFTYFVFDNWQTPGEYLYRHIDFHYRTIDISKGPSLTYIQELPQTKICSLKELEHIEEEFTSKGYEGVILRHPSAPYKHGRSTLREQYLLKLKRFQDSEAVITGFEPLRHNENEAETDHLGLTKRSSHKGNKVADELLGAFIVQDVHNPNWHPKVGSGFTMDDRQRFWQNRSRMVGKTIKYKFLPVGTLEQPRHPIYLGLRDSSDFNTVSTALPPHQSKEQD